MNKAKRTAMIVEAGKLIEEVDLIADLASKIRFKALSLQVSLTQESRGKKEAK